MKPLDLRWLGRVPYRNGLALQEEHVAAVRDGRIAGTLLLLEHPPVITLGRGSNARHVLAPADELERLGIEVHESGRGGDVTFHGPGQLVGYPIVRLPASRRDAHRYLRDLEEVMIRTAAEFGVHAGRQQGLTGAWVGNRKLAAIGVRLSTGWITSHGFAFNVANDLSAYATIVPCGIRDRGVTSLLELTGIDPGIRDVAGVAARHVCDLFGLEPRQPDDPRERLQLAVPGSRRLC